MGGIEYVSARDTFRRWSVVKRRIGAENLAKDSSGLGRRSFLKGEVLPLAKDFSGTERFLLEERTFLPQKVVPQT
jgi:hypothetical protein